MRTSYIPAHDEHGGCFDHVAPPVPDAHGAGIRVPTWVTSPFAKKSHLEPTVYEHTSMPKFPEAVFGLPTLAPVNRLFDESASDKGSSTPKTPPSTLLLFHRLHDMRHGGDTTAEGRGSVGCGVTSPGAGTERS